MHEVGSWNKQEKNGESSLPPSSSPPSSGGWDTLDAGWLFKQWVKHPLSERGLANDIQQFLLCCLSPPCFWVAEWGCLGWSLECAVRWEQSVHGNSWCDKTGEEVPSTSRVFFLSQLHQSSRDVASLWGAQGGSEVAVGCVVLVLLTCHQLLVSNPGSLGRWQSDKDTLIVKCVCLLNLLTQSISLLLSHPVKVTWQQNKKRAAQ